MFNPLLQSMHFCISFRHCSRNGFTHSFVHCIIKMGFNFSHQYFLSETLLITACVAKDSQPYNSTLTQPYNSTFTQPYNSTFTQPYNSTLTQPYNCTLTQPFISTLTQPYNSTLTQPYNSTFLILASFA